MNTTTLTWTRPFFGVTHGTAMGKRAWATITDRGTFADLTLNAHGGRPFHPITEQHPTMEQAKAAAAEWIQTQH